MRLFTNGLVLASSLVFSVAAHSTGQVIYTCESKATVGYQGASLSPVIFSNKTPLRIIEQSDGYWRVEAFYDEWIYISSAKPPRNIKFSEWFRPEPNIVGFDFVMSLKTLRFSFTNTTNYLLEGTGKPHLAIGSCRKSNSN